MAFSRKGDLVVLWLVCGLVWVADVGRGGGKFVVWVVGLWVLGALTYGGGYGIIPIHN